MLRNVYLKTVREYRRSTMFFSIAGIALGLYVTLFYPTIRDATGFTDFLEELPEVMQSLMGDVETFTTAEGFLNTEMFTFMGPLVVSVFAILKATAAIAGEEEQNTLDQLLANPISRTNLLIQKAAAVLTSLAFLCAAIWVGLVGGSVLAGFDLSITGTTQAVIALFVLGATLGMIAFAVGASTGKKGLAGGIAGAVGVVGFLLDTFLSVVELLEPARFISVFYYFNDNDVILNGINPVHMLTLVGIAVLSFAVSIWRFERRDLAN